MELVKVEIELNKTPNMVDFIYVQYAKADELYGAMANSSQPHTNFEPFVVAWLIQVQLCDQRFV